VIRYRQATAAAIAAAVAAHDPTWQERARSRTRALLAAGRYAEKSSIWGDVKRVYMRLQHFKCIFCERSLAGEEVGAIEQDVEHFRPKNAVKPWPPSTSPVFDLLDGRTGGASPGYYWLAYALTNYSSACKPCNTVCKSNIFPIAGTRGSAPHSVATLDRAERPFLICPYREDPEKFISFLGVVAVPKQREGFGRERALATIDVFQLNRSDLIADRFRTICGLFPWLQMRLDTPARAATIDRTLATLTADRMPQAACGRAFVKLARRRFGLAKEIFSDAEAYFRVGDGA